MRVSTITPEGNVYVGDVVRIPTNIPSIRKVDIHPFRVFQSAGDIWYFPAGNPHSLQAKDTDPEGSEFLIIFDEGNFSEDSTFQLTDWLAHVPKSVVAKNFGLSDNLEAFDRIPEKELYIFPCKSVHCVFRTVHGRW